MTISVPALWVVGNVTYQDNNVLNKTLGIQAKTRNIGGSDYGQNAL